MLELHCIESEKEAEKMDTDYLSRKSINQPTAFFKINSEIRLLNPSGKISIKTAKNNFCSQNTYQFLHSGAYKGGALGAPPPPWGTHDMILYWDLKKKFNFRGSFFHLFYYFLHNNFARKTLKFVWRSNQT